MQNKIVVLLCGLIITSSILSAEEANAQINTPMSTENGLPTAQSSGPSPKKPSDAFSVGISTNLSSPGLIIAGIDFSHRINDDALLDVGILVTGDIFRQDQRDNTNSVITITSNNKELVGFSVGASIKFQRDSEIVNPFIGIGLNIGADIYSVANTASNQNNGSGSMYSFNAGIVVPIGVEVKITPNFRIGLQINPSLTFTYSDTEQNDGQSNSNSNTQYGLTLRTGSGGLYLSIWY